MMDALDHAVASAMRQAAQTALLKHYRNLSDSDVREKTPGDAVTIADHESEAILADALARLEPRASIVGEEAAAAKPATLDQLSHGSCWIIDPLDGTNNYAKGQPPFGIIIALAEAGETVRGWIYDPLRDRLCHARSGGGAFVDDEPVKARSTGKSPPVAAISLIFMDQRKRADTTAHIAPHYHVVDIPRCAAEQYPRLALGINDVSLFERTLAWDHAAGVLWLNEAGGMAARPDGTAYRPDQTATGLIGAASPLLFESLALRIFDMPNGTTSRHPYADR